MPLVPFELLFQPNVCFQHKHIPEKLKAKAEELKNRESARIRLWKYHTDTKVMDKLDIPPYLRGTSTYASVQRRRLQMSELRHLKYMFTLTEGERSGCKFCSWKSFPRRWGTFVRKLRSCGLANAYFVSLEATQDYWPHYHALMDGHFVPREQLIELTELWGSRGKYEKVRSSIGYAMKYTTKQHQNYNFLALLSLLNLRQFYTSKHLLVSKRAVTSLGHSQNTIYYFGDI